VDVISIFEIGKLLSWWIIQLIFLCKLLLIHIHYIFQCIWSIW